MYPKENKQKVTSIRLKKEMTRHQRQNIQSNQKKKNIFFKAAK